MSSNQTSSSPVITFRKARAQELDAFTNILEGAAEWMVKNGYTQWTPGMFNSVEGKKATLESIKREDAYFIELEQDTTKTKVAVGTFVLQMGQKFDEALWSRYEGDWLDAVYLHRLVVDKSYKGLKMGPRVILFGQQVARDLGKKYIRLDCRASNPDIAAYYLGLGLLEDCGIHDDEDMKCSFHRFQRLATQLDQQ
ncbi:hypothetical protein BGZ73_008310 [Actinomortierella ambigua]|nr:hypothetical protein BGZ73_008310 [Actinomortierella ambigua]